MTSGINRIRVLIVDDHEMVRGGLAAFLHSADDLEQRPPHASAPAPAPRSHST